MTGEGPFCAGCDRPVKLCACPGQATRALREQLGSRLGLLGVPSTAELEEAIEELRAKWGAIEAAVVSFESHGDRELLAAEVLAVVEREGDDV